MLTKNIFHIQKHANRLSAGLECLNSMFDLIGALAFLGLGIWFCVIGKDKSGRIDSTLYLIYGAFRNVFLEIGQYLPPNDELYYLMPGENFLNS